MSSFQKVWKLKDENKIDELIKLLKKEKWPGVFSEIIDAIIFFKDKKAIPTIIEAIENRRSVRNEAIRGLGVIGDKSHLPLIVQYYNDESKYVRKETAIALYNLGRGEYIEIIRKLAVDEDDIVRSQAIKILGELKDTQSKYLIENSLNDKSSIVRGSTINALKNYGMPDIASLLKSSLKDKNKIVKLNAIESLGKFEDPQTIELLINLLKDPDKLVRRKAAIALELNIEQIKDKDLLATLKDYINYKLPILENDKYQESKLSLHYNKLQVYLFYDFLCGILLGSIIFFICFGLFYAVPEVFGDFNKKYSTNPSPWRSISNDPGLGTILYVVVPGLLIIWGNISLFKKVKQIMNSKSFDSKLGSNYPSLSVLEVSTLRYKLYVKSNSIYKSGIVLAILFMLIIFIIA